MSTNSNKSLYRLSICLVGGLLSLPVLFVKYPPLVDYPNHLARAYILFHYREVPVFQMRYTRLFEPIPNLAIDAVVFFLQSFVNVLTAGRIFLVTAIVLFVFGCHLLGKVAHGRPTWLALPCCFFVYNSAFLYGFVNYIFGVGLFCIALAYWLKSRKHWQAKALILSSALVLCAFLAHLSAYIFLGVSFVIVELWDLRARRESFPQTILSFVPLAPALLAFVAFMRGSGSVGRIEWNTIGGKLVGLLPLLLSYNHKLDLFFAAATLLIVALLARKIIRITVAWPLFAVGVVFIILYLLSPKVLFTASGADARFVLPAILLLVLSLRIEAPLRTVKVLMIVYLMLAAVRVGAIWSTWSTLDKQTAAEVERLMLLPEGATVYPLFKTDQDTEKNKFERSFEHSVHYATIFRHAFVPTLFALRGQQPLLFRATPRYFASPDADTTQWLRDISGYDYVWSYGIGPDIRESLVARSTFISQANGFALWKVNSVNKPAKPEVISRITGSK